MTKVRRVLQGETSLELFSNLESALGAKGAVLFSDVLTATLQPPDGTVFLNHLGFEID